MSIFTIKAGPGSDIWRKPPAKDIFNVKTASKLSSFRSATVSFSFSPTKLYDQGGLVLSVNPPSSSGSSTPAKWVKAGIELYNGEPVLGIVACDAWADWSLAPVPTSPTGAEFKERWITLTLDRGTDENGVSLWIYLVDEATGEKKALREVCWVFEEEGLKDWTVDVKAYAARPAKEDEEVLEVVFRTLDVTWSE